MDYVLEHQMHTVLADSVYRDILSGATAYHYYMGGVNGTTDLNAYPSRKYELSARNSIIGTKRIGAADVSMVIPRHNWTTGTVYDAYDDDLTNYPAYSGATTLENALFYVVTDDFNVYKCIRNNHNAQSTIKPTGTSSSIFVTSDGYYWKYMYSIPLASRNKFMNTSFIPVQNAVQEPFYSAGKISSFTITNPGTGYSSCTLTVVGDGTGAILTPVLTSGQITNVIITNPGSGYTYANVHVTGTGTNGSVVVNLSTGDLDTNQSTVELVAIDGGIHRIPMINVGSGYTNATVTITGDGTGATATANIVGGTIYEINVTNPGTGYHFANVTITGNGTGATARAVMSPIGGHGKNAVNELCAKHLLFFTTITGDKNQGFPLANNFVQIGIMRDIRVFQDIAKFFSVNGSAMWAFTYTGATPQLDDNLVDSVSGARYKVFAVQSGQMLCQSFDNVTPSINSTLNNLTHGGQHHVTAIVSPTIDKFSGEMLYIGNVQAIYSSADQLVTLKTTIKF